MKHSHSNGLLAAALVLLALGGRARAEGAVPRVYLDCGEECRLDYYRQELNYFDWVRDRHDADFAISAVEQIASNGGSAYTITLRQPRLAARASIVRVVTTQPGDQPATLRKQLLDGILRCLFDALRGTPHERTFTLQLPLRSERDLAAVRDGWDSWVFTPELLAELTAETKYLFLKLDGTLNIQRITDASKIRSLTRYSRRSVSYVFEDEERVTGTSSGVQQRLLYARSIGKHWALGALAVGAWGEMENLKLHLHGGPVLEWNLFPYRENASRQLRFAYQVGAWYSRYFERTLFVEFKELRPYHALSMIVDLNQAWGSIQGVVQANSFIDKPEQWRLACGVTLSVSLIAGLALQFKTEVARIEDQIGLRARTLSDREVYLETKELQKNFTVEGEFGFSYTFGSVFNTIVNPRFGRIDLEED